jgi:hypothetical protein
MYSLLFLIAVSFNVFVITAAHTSTIVFILFNLCYVYGGLMFYFHLRKAVSTLNGDIEREIGFWMAKAETLQQKI